MANNKIQQTTHHEYTQSSSKHQHSNFVFCAKINSENSLRMSNTKGDFHYSFYHKILRYNVGVLKWTEYRSIPIIPPSLVKLSKAPTVRAPDSFMALIKDFTNLSLSFAT